MRAGFLSTILLRLSAALLLIVAAPAFAQDPPGRIGRINYSEGAVSFAPAGDDEFTDADLNRPLVVGDKLWTDKGVRAELQVGSAAVRMDGRTHLTVLAIDDQSTQLSLTQGTVFVRVRSLPEGENFEVDTPNLAWRASYPGDYRIDVDAQRGTTRVTIHSGTGAVYGEKAQALPMGGGQQIVFKGRALAQVNANEQPPQDNFDRWAAERNRREDQSVAARYVPREIVGYQLLDTGGQWQQDANYGVVWFPANVREGWAPYRNGRWEWIAPWGWTWIDETPWAFVTTHYGRWALIGKQWGWVPGRMGLRPIYSPALVAFIGNAAPAAGAKQAIAWFPLAPGEAWQPTYKASALYISSVNANMPPVQQGGTYAHQRRAEALTALAVEDFQRGKPSKGNALRVAAGAFSTAQVITPPAVPDKARTLVARTPAPSPDFKPAVNRGPTAAQQLQAQRQADEAKHSEAEREAAQARKLAEANAQRERERIARDEQLQRQQREEQAKAEQARRSDEAKLAQEQQKRAAADEARIAQEQKRAAAEQARLAQQQRAAEQTARRAEQARGRDDREKRERTELAAKRATEEARQVAQDRQRASEEAKVAQKRQRAAAEQAKREVAAKREQARREQVAALVRDREARREQAAAKARAERELQARRVQEARRLAAAKKEDEARRIAHAQQVEQSRRAAEREAQVLQAQRAQREEALRRVAEEKEKERTQREAWARQQQQLAEQWKRDQQAYEEQQRRAQQRARPDLRRTQPAPEPEVWQRGVPIINPGRTS